jgi:hypothetical protein
MAPDGERRARVALSFLAQPGDPVLGAAQRVNKRIVLTQLLLSQSREPTSAMAVNESRLGSSADGKSEEGIDRSFERAGTLMYLGE